MGNTKSSPSLRDIAGENTRHFRREWPAPQLSNRVTRALATVVSRGGGLPGVRRSMNQHMPFRNSDPSGTHRRSLAQSHSFPNIQSSLHTRDES